MTRTILISLAAATLAAASPALATGPTAGKTAIDLGRLDLSKPSDVRILDRRIAAAKEAVCGSYHQARDGEEDAIAACRADVARQIEPQLAKLRAEAQLAQR
jgi:UrcA family protein